MRVNIIRCVCILILLSDFFGMYSIAAEQIEDRPVARVMLSVTAAQKLQGTISSFMARDLRKLGDVVVTDQDPDWHLAVTAVELQTAAGRRTGVALSTVIMVPLGNDFIEPIISVLEKEGSMAAALHTLKTSRLTEVKSSWLRVDADTAVRRLCQGIVADFNAQYLEIERRKYQERRGKGK